MQTKHIKGSSPSDEVGTVSELSLKEFFAMLWNYKVSLVTSMLAGLIVSVYIALSQPNIYTANAVLAPVDQNGGGGLSGLMKQYGSLARLAGVPVSGGEADARSQMGIHLMGSRSFLSDFIERRDILPELIAAKSWDSVSRELIFDETIYDASAGEWRENGAAASTKPSAQRAYGKMLEGLNISQDNLTGYVTVSFDHQSPDIAARWIGWLVEDVNAAVREQVIIEASQSIEYLQAQASKTSLAELRIMFYELIQSQTETMMLAEVRPEYVFKTIDPAITPEIRSRPNRTLISTFGVILGGIFGLLYVLILQLFKEQKLWL